ncbi:uncharacterized protein LOC122499436 [Leptopilina heterotoma]|uniref:uncharacterized protein LOC122499436 n=1 Tax=Leptopilina heterotoma TaxID=63436 RepID=UPI001CA86C7A|nr:uncharacterized protein LOC122499436 [Leptopilina heterotoma]XP_043463727.1 uncharacterized protein LOC122499436 [Leptopilina heterotoma]
MTLKTKRFLIFCVTLLCMSLGSDSIKCYQCSSDTDPKGSDVCGSYNKFDKETNIAIECNTEESHMPGSFCVKYVQQSPRGFIWDGRWRQVIRRCASVASTGVTGVCNWGIYENGVYWEECYCSEDYCNGTSSFKGMSVFYVCIIAVMPLIFFWR